MLTERNNLDETTQSLVAPEANAIKVPSHQYFLRFSLISGWSAEPGRILESAQGMNLMDFHSISSYFL